MTGIAIKVGQIWSDCDPRRPNRYLLVKIVTDTRVTLSNLRTGHVCGVRRDRMKHGRKGYFLAMDPEIIAQVEKQLGAAERRDLAFMQSEDHAVPKPAVLQKTARNGMKRRRCEGRGRQGVLIVPVNEIESLVDCGDRWQDLNRCTTELSTYMFGGLPGFTSKL